MGEIHEKIDIHEKREAHEKWGLCEGLARIVCAAIHPFMIPTYVVLVLLYAGTIHSFMPANIKLFIMLVVVVNTMVLPLVFVKLFSVVGYLKALPEQFRRVMIIMVCASLYATCVFMFSDLLTMFFVRKFFVAAIGCAMLSFVVSYFWNISTHMVAVGWGLSIFLCVSMSGMGALLMPIVILVLLGGAVASARLYLGRNTPMEVAMGLIAGVSVAAVLLI